ncbi:diaminopimelate decarboxylase family protein [Nocardia sp. NPDC057440]|uniref:diaminopimelate decarboxylase family protein n=1 Tax=Nocardia sp. NPDC057440 TaxID=3346134 RepID=UPI00366EBE34
MTLLDLFSSTRSVTAARLDTAIWPRDSHYDESGRIVVGGVALADIAERYGTVTMVLDEHEVRGRCRAYRKAFPETEIVYAGQALLVRTVVDWVADEGLSVAVHSADELDVALAAGVDPKRIIMHGNRESFDALVTAVDCHVGRIVAGSLAEINLLAAVATHPQRVLLRLSADIDVDDQPTEVARRTDFPVGAAAAAVEQVLSNPMLDLIGFHCHVGSQIYNPDYYGEAIRRMVAEMAQVRHDHGRILTDLDLGGGHAVAYRSGDAEMNLTELAAILEDALDAACARHRFPRPNIALEPGRGIVARAGVTLLRVRSVKHHDGGHTSVIVDSGARGGTRPAALASTVLANRQAAGPHRTATVAGRAGNDILATDIRLPADLRPGDLLAVPCTGAYQHGRALSDTARLPVIAVHSGRCVELVHREPDMLDRDAG